MYPAMFPPTKKHVQSFGGENIFLHHMINSPDNCSFDVAGNSGNDIVKSKECDILNSDPPD